MPATIRILQISTGGVNSFQNNIPAVCCYDAYLYNNYTLMFAFEFNSIQDLRGDERLQSEWLETNGLGGWASSTISGCHTRRYHGLLVAAIKPPSERMVMVS